MALIGVSVVIVAAVVVIMVSRSAAPNAPATPTAAFVGSDLHSIAIDPSNPQHLYVGGHQAASESHDGGRTFSQVPALDNADPMAWSISGDGQTEVTAGHYGVRVSHDGGKTWADVTSHLPGTDVHSLGVDPREPAKWWAFVVGRGVYASNDGGGSWALRGGTGLSFMGPIVVLPSGALLGPDMQRGIVRSDDGGKTWAPFGSHGYAFLTADPKNGLHLFAAADSISESTDGGANWRQLAGGPRTQTVAAGSDGSLYSADLQGGQVNIYRSTDGGGSWSLASGK